MEGTIKDGVIKWKGPKGNASFEGKLVGNELVGTLKGSNWQGDWSGEFRLTLDDDLPTEEQFRPGSPPAWAVTRWDLTSWALAGPLKATSS